MSAVAVDGAAAPQVVVLNGRFGVPLAGAPRRRKGNQRRVLRYTSVTIPQYRDREEVREVERLYLDAIVTARRALYCEGQCFVSRRLAEAIAERLRQKDGPEIVVINPESADGFLEAETMDTARYRLLKLIRETAAFNRFRIYTPVTEKRQPIHVHAKIMIVDDCLLRVGSSNFNNRPWDSTPSATLLSKS